MASLNVPIKVEFTDEEQELLVRSCKLYKEQNAKLRELAVDMYSFARTLGYDHPLLHELGVDVDA